MDFKKRINKAFDDVDKILQDGTDLPAKIRVPLRHALENLATACTSYDDYDRGYLPNSRKPIKSDFDDNGNWVDDEKPVKKEDMHGSFRKLSKEEHDELKPQVEEELDRWMSKKHFGLDKEVYDETVEYIISLFGEDNYAPKDVKEAVSSWYNDTLDSFPEMLQGKGEKRKIASSAYLKQIKSSHCIKSSKKPIKSALDYNRIMKILSQFYLGWGIDEDDGYEGYAFWDYGEPIFRLKEDWVNFDYDNATLEIKQGNEECAELFEDFIGIPKNVTYARGLIFKLSDPENGPSKNIKSFDFIKSSKKPIKSSTYQFVCEFDGQYQPRAIVHIDHQGLPIWEDADEGYSNAKSFSEEELANAVKNITEYNDYNDIDIVRDDGESVSIPEFLKAGSFDAAYAKAVEEDDKWPED